MLHINNNEFLEYVKLLTQKSKVIQRLLNKIAKKEFKGLMSFDFVVISIDNSINLDIKVRNLETKKFEFYTIDVLEDDIYSYTLEKIDSLNYDILLKEILKMDFEKMI